uniref:Uncharacterized protein n=1 Tax=Anguilla anguilla TaxID=7936 RepID=A0A0E9V1N2_ANGAN
MIENSGSCSFSWLFTHPALPHFVAIKNEGCRAGCPYKMGNINERCVKYVMPVTTCI